MYQVHTPIVEWSITRKILFRLCFLFFTLFIFFNPNGFIPFSDNVYEFYIQPFHKLIVWAGAHILHLSYPITAFTGGSGDTTYDWLMLVFVILLSVVGCVIWSLIDRRRLHYRTLLYWLVVIVRFYFAFTMFLYGFAKVFKSQFPYPGPYDLMTPYGNSSPMGLAWRFMGYSTGYNYFMGFAEVASGVLLMFRRTMRVGAIVSLAVVANVMAINYGFDVCVKLVSTVLVIMAVFLLLQGWEHHLNFFFLNKDVRPESLTRPQFRRRWINRALGITKYVVIIGVLGYDMHLAYKYMDEYGDHSKRPPLYGVYNVQTFVRGQDTVLPLTTDTTRWRRLIVENYFVSVQMMSDSMVFYTGTPDTVKKTIALAYRKDSTRNAQLAYSIRGKDTLILAGRWKGDSVRMVLQKYDTDSMLLVRRGFHLINERPFNR